MPFGHNFCFLLVVFMLYIIVLGLHGCLGQLYNIRATLHLMKLSVAYYKYPSPGHLKKKGYAVRDTEINRMHEHRDFVIASMS